MSSPRSKDLAPQEALVATRSRRKNAGSRLRQLLEQEAPLEDEENIFMEVEGDEEFDLEAEEKRQRKIKERRKKKLKRKLSANNKESKGDNNNNANDDPETSQMEENTDTDGPLNNDNTKDIEEDEDDDDDSNKIEDDDDVFSDSDSDSDGKSDEEEGEKELQRQIQQDKKNKRTKFKVPPIIAKRPISNSSSEVKEKKRKFPTSAQLLDSRRRSSSRTAAVQNREAVIKRLEESEKRRAKYQPVEKPKIHHLTQEERLKEAEITEQKNILSLNRFKEQEYLKKKKQRAAMLARRPHLTSVISYISTSRLIGPVAPPRKKLIEDITSETTTKSDEDDKKTILLNTKEIEPAKTNDVRIDGKDKETHKSHKSVTFNLDNECNPIEDTNKSNDPEREEATENNVKKDNNDDDNVTTNINISLDDKDATRETTEKEDDEKTATADITEQQQISETHNMTADTVMVDANANLGVNTESISDSNETVPNDVIQKNKEEFEKPDNDICMDVDRDEEEEKLNKRVDVDNAKTDLNTSAAQGDNSPINNEQINGSEPNEEIIKEGPGATIDDPMDIDDDVVIIDPKTTGDANDHDKIKTLGDLTVEIKSSERIDESSITELKGTPNDIDLLNATDSNNNTKTNNDLVSSSGTENEITVIKNPTESTLNNNDCENVIVTPTTSAVITVKQEDANALPLITKTKTPTPEPEVQGPYNKISVSTINLIDFPDNIVLSRLKIKEILFGKQSIIAPKYPSKHANPITITSTSGRMAPINTGSSSSSASSTKRSCLITGKPAVYFDPKTNIPYSSIDAYRVIKKISQGKVAWCGDLDTNSSIIGGGAYLGWRIGRRHAKGVPEGFDG